jgi:hypothetical protein
MWRKYFSQLLNVYAVNNIKETELHTAEPLVPQPTAFEVELAIEKLKSNISPDIDQIPAELIKAVGGKILPEIHKIIISTLVIKFNLCTIHTLKLTHFNIKNHKMLKTRL